MSDPFLCPQCNNTGCVDSGGFREDGHPIDVQCPLCKDIKVVPMALIEAEVESDFVKELWDMLWAQGFRVKSSGPGEPGKTKFRAEKRL